MYSVNKCISNAYYAPGSVLGTGDTAVKEMKLLPLWWFHSREGDRKQMGVCACVCACVYVK